MPRTGWMVPYGADQTVYLVSTIEDSDGAVTLVPYALATSVEEH